MKTQSKFNVNGIISLLILLICVQSCKIYHSETYTLDKAIASGESVKLEMKNNNTYHFKKLVMKEDHLYGFVKKHTDTYMDLQSKVVSDDKESKLAILEIDKNEIDAIKVKNNSASTIVTVLGILSLVGGLGYLLATSISVSPGLSGI